MSTDAFTLDDLPDPRDGRKPRFSLVDGMRSLASALVERSGLASAAGITFGGRRDMYAVLGYPRELGPRDYRARYRRGDIAARIVEAYPKATWRGGAELVEDEDPDVSTAFEEEWAALDERLGVWSLLSRTDTLCGLGRYAVLLIGASGKLAEPLPQLSGVDDIAYLAPYGEDEAVIDQLEENPENERFGLPLFYVLSRTNGQGGRSKTFSSRVHWSRVLHVADGLLDDRVLGTPRLERVWNRLDDLDKVAGGGSEAYWLRVHQGMVFNIDPNIKVEKPEIDKLKEEAEEFAHQMRRTIAARGFSVDTTKSDVSPFKQPVEALISIISGATGIPQRILLGSERGQLASTQDKENWDERVSDRRREYAEPIVRALVEILQDHGALSETPDGYEIRWPELKALSEVDQAAIATSWAGLNKKAGGVVVTPEEIRDRVLGLEALEEDQIEEQEVEDELRVAPVGPPPPPVEPEPPEDDDDEEDDDA